MPVYEFRGLNEGGKPVSGLKEAESAKTLRSALRKDGVFLTEVVGQADSTRAAGRGKAEGSVAATQIDLRKLARGRITTDDIAIMTRQLATLLGAGVALVEALGALVDQVEKERFKRVLSDVISQSQPRPITPYYMMMSTELQSQFSAAIAGIRSPQEAMHRAARTVEVLTGEEKR